MEIRNTNLWYLKEHLHLWNRLKTVISFVKRKHWLNGPFGVFPEVLCKKQSLALSADLIENFVIINFEEACHCLKQHITSAYVYLLPTRIISFQLKIQRVRHVFAIMCTTFNVESVHLITYWHKYEYKYISSWICIYANILLIQQQIWPLSNVRDFNKFKFVIFPDLTTHQQF